VEKTPARPPSGTTIAVGPERVITLTHMGPPPVSADRNELLKAWNAFPNLAELSGKVSVNVRAESENGFDRNKLRTG
jgi:hypothetical protein